LIHFTKVAAAAHTGLVFIQSSWCGRLCNHAL